MTVAAAPLRPRAGTPGRRAWAWVRGNLINTWYNAVVSVVMGAVLAYAAFRAARWAFITADWEIVRVNLTNAMIGRFPRSDIWRPWAQLHLVMAAIGWASGAALRSAADRAAEAGLEPPEPVGLLGGLRRFWPLVAMVAAILSMTRTPGPTLGVLSAAATLVVFRHAGRLAPAVIRRRAWFVTGALGLASMQVVTGLGGTAWVWAAGLFGALLWTVPSPRPLPGAVLIGIRALAVVVVALVVRATWTALASVEWERAGDLERPFVGVGWSEWGGLQLSLFVTVVGIALAFPIGLAAALGRRSSLPALRVVSIGYIEFVRGVPLITLLLVGVKALEFFFPPEFNVPAQVTLAMIMVMLFTGAYIAEIVRGGLQAVPRGQWEAAQALGLPAGLTIRLIVLPQALRAVIPAMVGQFISLFKDTSLLAIIGIFDLLRFSEVANAQPQFVGRGGFAMTLPFAAFIYWAVSYTMSRESQRLERRLGVGER